MKRPKMVTIKVNMYQGSLSYGVPFGVNIWYRGAGQAQAHYVSASFEQALCHNLTKKQRAQVVAARDAARDWYENH